jgi:F420-non-reducing hydrogenase iron-sulfur subunit
MMVRALSKCADGVLIVGCHETDCDYDTGVQIAKRNVAVAKKALETTGIGAERLEMAHCSAAEGARFRDLIIDFTKKIQDLGPNPVKTLPRKPAKKAAKPGAKPAKEEAEAEA